MLQRFFSARGINIVVLVLLMHCSICGAETHQACARIVSLAPSITETLVELGLIDNIVAVTTFDKYPAAITKKPVVGGLLDISIERIVRERPTVVFALVEEGRYLDRLDDLGIVVRYVDHRSVSGIFKSIKSISQYCDIRAKGHGKLQQLRGAMQVLGAQLPWHKEDLSVLIVVGRESSSSGVESVYVSGRDGYYHDLVQLGGFKNAYTGPTLAVATLSKEGLYQIDPDIIIEMVGDSSTVSLDDKAILASWQSLSQLKAVKSGSIYILRNDFVVVPGPRMVKLLEKMIDVVKDDWPKIESMRRK